jgi:hypothetical protein
MFSRYYRQVAPVAAAAGRQKKADKKKRGRAGEGAKKSEVPEHFT